MLCGEYMHILLLLSRMSRIIFSKRKKEHTSPNQTKMAVVDHKSIRKIHRTCSNHKANRMSAGEESRISNLKQKNSNEMNGNGKNACTTKIHADIRIKIRRMCNKNSRNRLNRYRRINKRVVYAPLMNVCV